VKLIDFSKTSDIKKLVSIASSTYKSSYNNFGDENVFYGLRYKYTFLIFLIRLAAIQYTCLRKKN